MKIYVASSWKNDAYPAICELLENRGHETLNWRANGFNWGMMDTGWESWTASDYRQMIYNHSHARNAFKFDFGLMKQADLCVLLLPSGRSAHIEAGWFAGAGIPVIVHLDKFDGPDLMWKLGYAITTTRMEMLREVDHVIAEQKIGAI